MEDLSHLVKVQRRWIAGKLKGEVCVRLVTAIVTGGTTTSVADTTAATVVCQAQT